MRLVPGAGQAAARRRTGHGRRHPRGARPRVRRAGPAAAPDLALPHRGALPGAHRRGDGGHRGVARRGRRARSTPGRPPGSPISRSSSPTSAASAPSSACRTSAGSRPASPGSPRQGWPPTAARWPPWCGWTSRGRGSRRAPPSRSRSAAARWSSSWTRPAPSTWRPSGRGWGAISPPPRRSSTRRLASWATRRSSRRHPPRRRGHPRAAGQGHGRHRAHHRAAGRARDMTGPEGEGEVPEQEDALVAHVLDAIRGADSPDVVPATSSVVSYAEFLAVEAALDKRWPETAMEPSTERIAGLVDALGEPHRGYPIVHLTGTNGKTSTARMVDALLTEIGLRTGRYTSPHLQRATERINIDNRPVTPERYVELYHEVAPFVDIVGCPARRAVEVRGAHRDGLRRVRRRPGGGGGGRGRARRAVGRHQRRRRHGRGDHADRRRPRGVPRLRRAGHRAGEVRGSSSPARWP